MQFSWQANHSLKNKVFVYQAIQSEKAKKVGVQNLVCSGFSGFMYDLSVYDWKNSVELDDGQLVHLQKCAQVVAKLCNDLPVHKNYKVFFDNWLTTLDLLHHFKLKGIHAVGAIWLNRLRGCSLDANKDLKNNGRGTIDYQLGSWKDDAERRRWGKTFHFLKLFNNATKAWEVSTWPTCCYHCVGYRARQSAGIKRYFGISMIWQKSKLGSYTIATLLRMESGW